MPFFSWSSWADVRGPEWLGQKLVPAIGVFLATCLILDQSIVAAWRALLVLAIAIVTGAIYVSLINDLTDRAQDRAVGKANRVDGKSPNAVRLALGAMLCAGVAVGYAWRDAPVLLAAYAAAWAAFTLYSVRPFRWKERGLAGVIADATGAHLAPALIAMLLAFRHADRPVDGWWLAAVAMWSAGYGLRGILWHQLVDLEQDRLAGVRTFAWRYGRRVTAGVARWLAFPIELAGLAAMVWLLAQTAVTGVLIAYAIVVVLKSRLVGARYAIVEAGPGYRLVLAEFYDCLLPLALLVAAASHHPRDLVALAVAGLLLHRRIVTLASEGFSLAAGMVRRIARSIRVSP